MPIPNPLTFTPLQKLALELVERRHLSREDAARKLGYKNPAGVGRLTFTKLLARARRARQHQNRIIEEYLEGR